MSDFNQPLSGNDMPRFGGIASLFRLPVQADASGLDIALVGVPLDCGTSNRAGSRYGPRQIRAESVLVRPLRHGYRRRALRIPSRSPIPGTSPSTPTTSRNPSASSRPTLTACSLPAQKPSPWGGDHTITLPILRALARVHGPVAVVHVDAHADMNDHMFGEPVTHGTIFRRAIEEGLIEPQAMVQIGLRATGYAADDFDWARQRGVRVVPAGGVLV